jgi:outer membrane protein insertion porin family
VEFFLSRRLALTVHLFKGQIGCKPRNCSSGQNQKTTRGQRGPSPARAKWSCWRGSHPAELRFHGEEFTIRHVKNHFLRWIVAGGVLTATALSFGAVAQAQTTGATAKIGSIHVTGGKRFNEEQVVAATGLKTGQAFDPKTLDAVAEKLGKSGAFSDITYSYVAENGLVSITFKVEESPKFRKCVFDNFVWLSDEEIQAGLKRELPLYDDVAPETGGMLDEIAAALVKLSKEKGVSVRVERRIAAAAVGDPNWSHIYSAEGADAKVQSLRFTGKLTVNADDLQKQVGGLVGREYSEFQSRLFATAKLLPYYRERGYLQAKVETEAPKILSHADGSNSYAMEVVYAVTEGNVYRWEAAEWSGDRALAAGELEAATGMKPNELANGIKIDEGWGADQKEYSKNGYIEAGISPEPVFDEQNRLVHYRVTVTEGPQYHMGNFVISGAPPKTLERLKDRWKLKPGDVYDASYPMDFVKKEVFPSVRGRKVGVRTMPNREQHIMDVAVSIE